MEEKIILIGILVVIFINSAVYFADIILAIISSIKEDQE